MPFLLDEDALKTCIDSVEVEHVDTNPLKKYKAEMEKTKRMILDGFKDHVVCHVASKETYKEMWYALATLYHGSSEEWKMYLDQKLIFSQMQKGERVDPFLMKL